MALVNCPECGKEVSSTAESCPNCGYGVREHFFNIEYAEIIKRNEAIHQKKRKRNIRILIIAIPAFILLISISLGIIINNYILSKRTVFNTRSEMIAYLAKYNNWECDNQYIEKYLVFHDSGFVEVLSKIRSHGEIGVYYPKRGKFSISGIDYYISNTEDVIEIGKKGRNKRYKSSIFTPPLEYAAKALSVEVSPPSVSENRYLETKVKIKNNGKNTYKFIRLKTTLTNNSNQTYSPENEFSYVNNIKSPTSLTLKSGDTGECDIAFFITDRDFNLKNGSCSVNVISYDSEIN